MPGSVAGVAQEKAFTVEQPCTLLAFLLELPGMSRRDAKNLLRYRSVAVSGVAAPRHDTPLARGTMVRISGAKHTPSGTVLPSGIEIVHEDEALLVINKPAGLLTIATETEQIRTAYHHLTSYVRDRSPRGEARVFIVHRLDRDTSGLLMFARTEAVKFALQKAWSSVTKRYQAIVEGTPSPTEGTFRSQLAETDSLLVHPTRTPREDAKTAVTHYRVLRCTKIYAHVELTLQTGRKNQIRVQLAEAGHPIVGDDKYGAKTDPVRRLALHACELRFRHPLTGEALEFNNPLPTKLRALIANVPPASASGQLHASSARTRVEPQTAVKKPL